MTANKRMASFFCIMILSFLQILFACTSEKDDSSNSSKANAVQGGQPEQNSPVVFLIGPTTDLGSGILIGPRTILTAKHVVYYACDTNLRSVARQAEFNAYNLIGNAKWKDANVEKVACHPSANIDAAIVEVETDMNQPYSSVSEVFSSLGTQIKCIGYGWDMNDIGLLVRPSFPTGEMMTVDSEDDLTFHFQGSNDNYVRHGDSGGGCFSSQDPWIMHGIMIQMDNTFGGIAIKTSSLYDWIMSDGDPCVYYCQDKECGEINGCDCSIGHLQPERQVSCSINDRFCQDNEVFYHTIVIDYICDDGAWIQESPYIVDDLQQKCSQDQECRSGVCVEKTETCIDQDQDGFGQNCPMGNDCDDFNFEVKSDAIEVCDGIDNNCNHLVDEGDLCLNEQFCQDGSCIFECVADVEICDGIDNDCNHEVDEGNICPDGQLCQNGDCVNECPEEEFCDGIDNNCNNLIDEGDICLPNQFCQEGECVDECIVSEEICDNTDNDCDQIVDEDVFGAGIDCNTNLDRDSICYAGLTACVNGRMTCQPIIMPEAESCDGIDNDCDGDTDENDEIPVCNNGYSCHNGQCKTICGDGLCVEGEDSNECPDDCEGPQPSCPCMHGTCWPPVECPDWGPAGTQICRDGTIRTCVCAGAVNSHYMPDNCPP